MATSNQWKYCEGHEGIFVNFSKTAESNIGTELKFHNESKSGISAIMIPNVLVQFIFIKKGVYLCTNIPFTKSKCATSFFSDIVGTRILRIEFISDYVIKIFLEFVYFGRME